MRNLCRAVVTMVFACTLAGASEQGEKFPDFALKDLNGRTVSLSQFRGKILLLDFWMTTCPPCKQEMPAFQELQNKYADRGLVVVGISLDDKPRTAATFARKLGVKYTLLIHPTLMANESEQKKYGIIGLPTTYLIDRDGIVRKKVVGFEYKEQFETAIQTLLASQ